MRIDEHRGPAHCAEALCPLREPFPVHPVTSPENIATREPFMGLHEVVRTSLQVPADRARETPVAPGTAPVSRRQFDHGLPRSSFPLPGNDCHCAALLGQLPHCLRHETLGAA